MARDPSTPSEFQEAVNLAAMYTRLDAARQYGLITGGPIVDVDRCAYLLDLGGMHGYLPREDAVTALAAILARGPGGGGKDGA